ncbi:class I SAM-dependent methyltransferase [Spirillospora sp. NPDC047279]|uniref:class I SAM-dependent methyltransferase n=1 Tax=Spirillospora sp. NPDC047279 TaxID=3155478 RepID=UPI0033F9C5FD
MIWIPLLVASGTVAGAVRLRRRLAPLRVLPVPEDEQAARRAGDKDDGRDAAYKLVTAEGVAVPGRLRRAAFDHAFAHDLQVLDLVPADLPVERALDLARDVDLRTYRRDPVAPGRGAGFAALVAGDVLARAEVPAGALDRGAFGEATARLRQYALPPMDGVGSGAGMVAVPCRTAPRSTSGGGRRAWLRGLGVSVPRRTGSTLVSYGLVGAALVADPWWGVLAVVAYSAVPYIVFAGSAIRPRDLHRSALLRVVRTPWQVWATLRGRPGEWERRLAEREREDAARYAGEVAHGVDRFLQPRRDDCPWCGSLAFRKILTSGDVVHDRPGRFTLERCGDCGHVFQHPALNDAGREFYGRDVHGRQPFGLGSEPTERLGARRARVKFAASHVPVRPRAWLDVGAGHGRFCGTARTLVPGTAFDGLDTAAGVAEGARRGWLRAAYRGRFTDLKDELSGRYDLVSMNHYLQGVDDPLAELDAAAKILPPGGHLLIELPDPRVGRWSQPGHRHLISRGNLEAALAGRGLRVVARGRARHRYAAPGPGPLRGAGTARTAAVARWIAAVAWAAPFPGYRVLARKDQG